jgi:hypothetical protein
LWGGPYCRLTIRSGALCQIETRRSHFFLSAVVTAHTDL